eukprot:scaffold264_cov317-Pinguiococcus_pyrenoidosus.AAC.26
MPLLKSFDPACRSAPRGRRRQCVCSVWAQGGAWAHADDGQSNGHLHDQHGELQGLQLLRKAKRSSPNQEMADKICHLWPSGGAVLG